MECGLYRRRRARRTKQFAKKSAGEAWLVETCHDVARGIHTPGSISPTVKGAGALWIKRCKEKQLEATTIKGYEEHCELHIYPFIGAKKLSDLTVPAVNGFSDQLRDAGRSAEMIKKIIRSLGSIFKEARRRGLSNVAPTVGMDLDLPERDDPRPVIPTKAELQAIIAAATARKSLLWRALVLVAMTMMRWGTPPPPKTGGPPVTNIRNTSSPHWRGLVEA
jgi:integrase